MPFFPTQKYDICQWYTQIFTNLDILLGVLYIISAGGGGRGLYYLRDRGTYGAPLIQREYVLTARVK